MKSNYINLLLQHLNNGNSEAAIAGFLQEMQNDELQKCIKLNRSSYKFMEKKQTEGNTFLSDIDCIITQANVQIGRQFRVQI